MGERNRKVKVQECVCCSKNSLVAKAKAEQTSKAKQRIQLHSYEPYFLLFINIKIKYKQNIVYYNKIKITKRVFFFSSVFCVFFFLISDFYGFREVKRIVTQYG